MYRNVINDLAAWFEEKEGVYYMSRVLTASERPGASEILRLHFLTIRNILTALRAQLSEVLYQA